MFQIFVVLDQILRMNIFCFQNHCLDTYKESWEKSDGNIVVCLEGLTGSW